MATECNIEFENNTDSVFYGGQLVSGNVELKTGKPKSIRAIHITIEGFAYVHWKESRSRKENKRTVHYTVHYRAHDQYLSSRTYALGHEGGDSFDLVPGTYSYRFAVTLPDQLPSSFEGSHGHVRYQVVVTIDRPWRFDNVFKKPFTVLYALDLNRDLSYKSPICIEDDKTFCCCCCQSGDLTARLSVPFSGYAPGQNLPFIFLVENESNIDCPIVKVKLVQETSFTSDTPERKTRRESKKVAEKSLGPILKLCKKEFKDVLKIPSVPPSSITSCRMIKISYVLYGVVTTPSCHTNLEMTAPITIGSIPLYESATNPASVILHQPTAPDSTSGGDSPPGYHTVVPPSYEEASAMAGDVFVPDNVDEHAKVEPYVPKYPVYYNFATAPPIDGSNNLTGNPTAPPIDGSNNLTENPKGTNYGWKNQPC